MANHPSRTRAAAARRLSTTTLRYFTAVRPDGGAALRYWMADGTSARIEDYPTRERAEAEAERLNARQAASDAAWAARDAADAEQST